MRASLLILLLCGLHAAKATLNYHHFSKPFEILTDNAAKNLKDFVDSMHFENVQKLIWPKVQNNVDYVKKLLEPSTIVKLALEQDRKTVNYELDKLQKLGDLKKQQFEEYFKKKALKLIVPPPPPPRPPTKTRHNHYHEEYVKEIGPSELFRIPPSMDQQKYEIYFEEIAPNKFIKVIKPWPYGKLVSYTTIHD